MKPRQIKIQSSPIAEGAAEVRLRGAWFTRAGFTPGANVTVTSPMPGCVMLQVVSGAGSFPPVAEVAEVDGNNLTHYAANLGEFQVRSLRETVAQFLCDTPEACANYYRQHIATFERHNPDCEGFYVLSLNTRRRVIGHQLVSQGTLDTILIHPREVFRGAMAVAAAAIVLMHNHPSGDPTPSEADCRVTRELIKAGQLLKIEVLDHVVMGAATAERPFSSLRELGYFC